MVMGVDEAGRGPVMGPLVVAAAGCSDLSMLNDSGIRDSKVLSPKKRGMIFSSLRERISSAVMVVPARCIDSAREYMSMNRLEVLCFSSVLASLKEGKALLHPDIPEGMEVLIMKGPTPGGPAYLDAADVNEERFGTSVGTAFSQIMGSRSLEIISRHKADRDHVIVSTASIIAKVIRDQKVSEISEQLGCHVGSGYPSDPSTRDFLKKWVEDNGELPPYCRRSWNTARRMVETPLQSTLANFE